MSRGYFCYLIQNEFFTPLQNTKAVPLWPHFGFEANGRGERKKICGIMFHSGPAAGSTNCSGKVQYTGSAFSLISNRFENLHTGPTLTSV